MFRKTFTIFLMVALLLCLNGYAGKYNFKRVQKVSPEMEAKWQQKLNNIKITSTPTVQIQSFELGRTWYDYACNTTLGRMTDYALDSQDGQDGIHFAYMKQFPQSAERIVNYDYFDLNLRFFFGNSSVKDNTTRTGWGRVANGRSDEVLLVHHGEGLHLWQDAGEVNYSFSLATPILLGAPEPNANAFPQIHRFGDYVIFGGNFYWEDGGDVIDGDDTLLVSSDYMQTWTSGKRPPLPPRATDGGSVEVTPVFNPQNLNEIAYCYAPDTVDNQGPESIGLGGTILATLQDWQTTPWVWDQVLIQRDDEIFPGNLQLIIENFSQMNYLYTQDGNFHVVYGAVQGVLDTATSSLIDYYPILYWNKENDQLVELTDKLHSTPTDTTIIEGLGDFRPGNGLGNSYAHIAEGPNGDLLVVWQQWENDGPDILITQVGTGGNEIFMTDFYGAYSPDGGDSWTEPFFVAGTANQSDVFPYIPSTFMWNAAGDSFYIDLLYMVDSDPGVSLFDGNNNPSECIWYYERVAIKPPTITAIGDEFHSVVDRFELTQNYPNPFNPTTTIKFYLPKTSKVTIDVFNTLGQKVATVVDKKMKSGKNEIVFDASEFASGIYYYRMSAEDFSMTKKMVLMK